MIENLLKTLIVPSQKIVEIGKAELDAQGHVASGKLRESIKFEIDYQNGTITIDFLIEDYGTIVDTGVAAANVPFGNGGGATSKYIQGLLNWTRIIKPSLSDKARKGWVFAIAKTHKKEGISSIGSKRFSKNGERKGWIKQATEKKALQIINPTEFSNLYIEEIIRKINASNRV